MLLKFCEENKNNKNIYRTAIINDISLWNDYLTANRTISDLSILHKCSERTIRRRLSIVVDSFTATCPKSAVIILDTTYFSKTFGVMLFQDASSGKILYRKFVKNETNRDYLDTWVRDKVSMQTVLTALISQHKQVEPQVYCQKAIGC